MFLINRLKRNFTGLFIPLNSTNNYGKNMENIEDTDEERAHNKMVFMRAREIEDSEWKELWLIVHGQDIKEFRKIYDSKTEEEKREDSVWDDWFDGSGMKSWWD